MDAERIPEKLGIREQIAQRIRDGECIICGRRDKLRRGLCIVHYHQFRRYLLSKQSGAERKAADQNAIRAGLVLEKQACRAVLRDNPFANL